MDNFSVNVGEAEIATGVAMGEVLVIEAEQVEDGGVDVVDGDRILFGLEAEFVGRSVNGPAADAAARHPDAESVGVVVATVL